MTDRPNPFGPGTSLVWNASLRSLHVALLLEGGAELAHEFWLGHPLETENGTLQGAELFEHLWEEKGLTPLDYQLRVLDSVEAFCIHRGIPFLSFVRERVFQPFQGSVLSPLSALAMAGRVLLNLVRSRDIHWTIIETMDTIMREVAPELKSPAILRRELPDAEEGWLLQVHDHEFAGRHPGYDASIWLGFQLQLAPQRIGCEPFSDVLCVCEVRDLAHILEAIPKGLHPWRSEEGWMIEGRCVTRTVMFKDWARNQGLDLEPLRWVPDHPVQEALEDLVCPVRKRVVVHAGSVYGAKAYLMRLRWRKGAVFSLEQGLSQLIGEATGGKVLAEERHEELLRRYRHKLAFAFHRRDATMSCNGEHLLRGVPAKILQKVLMAYSLTNRTTFEHREFRRDPDLGLDPLNPNLEGRLRILSERLEDRLQGIRIVKNSRGQFKLVVTAQVEFVDKE